MTVTEWPSVNCHIHKAVYFLWTTVNMYRIQWQQTDQHLYMIVYDTTTEQHTSVASIAVKNKYSRTQYIIVTYIFKPHINIHNVILELVVIIGVDLFPHLVMSSPFSSFPFPPLPWNRLGMLGEPLYAPATYCMKTYNKNSHYFSTWKNSMGSSNRVDLMSLKSGGGLDPMERAEINAFGGHSPCMLLKCHSPHKLN